MSWVPRTYSNQPFPEIQSKDSKPAVDPKEQVKESDRLPRPTQTWWVEFGSEEMAELVETTLANNYDLRVAVARIEQAERQALIANSARYPELNFFVTRGMLGPSGGLGTATSTNDYRHKNEYSFGFRASYEVDLWGKIGFQTESALAQARASVFNRQVVALTLTSEVATAYLQILSLNERISISEKNIETANQVADALSKRVEQGDSTVLDLQRQQVTIALLQNVQANLTLQRDRLINRVATLLGKPVSMVKIQGKTLKGIKIPSVTPGLPSELLCRRPDIRRAEAQLAAASADVNAARANLLPSVTLTGLYGQGSQQLSDLLRPQSLLYNAAANLVQNIFDGDRRENQLGFARARNRELLDTYANTVLSALRDVEDALASIRLAGMQQEALAEVLARNNRLLDLSRTIFDRGGLEYVALLDTQRDVFQAQDSEANARFEQARAAVDLFKALGGGIAPENDPCVADAKPNPLAAPKPAEKAAPDQPVVPKPDEAAAAKAKAEVDAAKAKAEAEAKVRAKAAQDAAAAKAKADAAARTKAAQEAAERARVQAAPSPSATREQARPRAEQEAAAPMRLGTEQESVPKSGVLAPQPLPQPAASATTVAPATQSAPEAPNTTAGTIAPTAGSQSEAPRALERLAPPATTTPKDQSAAPVSPAGSQPAGTELFPVN